MLHIGQIILPEQGSGDLQVKSGCSGWTWLVAAPAVDVPHSGSWDPLLPVCLLVLGEMAQTFKGNILLLVSTSDWCIYNSPVGSSLGPPPRLWRWCWCVRRCFSAFLAFMHDCPFGFATVGWVHFHWGSATQVPRRVVWPISMPDHLPLLKEFFAQQTAPLSWPVGGSDSAQNKYGFVSFSCFSRLC